MESSMKPSRLDLSACSATASKEWKHWLKTFENYVEILAQSLPEGRQVDKLKALVNCVSHNVFEQIEECETYNAAIERLTNLYTGTRTPNEVLARHLLTTAKQESGQSINEFSLSLERLAKDCNFRAVTGEQYKKEMILSAFINGINLHVIRHRLLQNRELSLEKAIQQAKELDLEQKSSNSSLHPTTNDLFYPSVAIMAHKTGREEKDENNSMIPGASQGKDISLRVKEKPKKKKKSKLRKADISLPPDFEHAIGWDPNKGFDINNVDPDLRQLFREAGVTENQMRDENIRRLIYEFIEVKGGIEAIKKCMFCKSGNFPPSPYDQSYHQPPEHPSRGSGLPPPFLTQSSSHQPPFQKRQLQRNHSAPVPLPRNQVQANSAPSRQTQLPPAPHLAPSIVSLPSTAPSMQPSTSLCSVVSSPSLVPEKRPASLTQIQQGTELKLAADEPAQSGGRDALLEETKREKDLKSVSHDPPTEQASHAGGEESLASTFVRVLSSR